MNKAHRSGHAELGTIHRLGSTTLRDLWFGMLLLVLISGSVLGYSLWQSAAITAHQVGQLEANLLAEGEAERLRLTFTNGIAKADPAQVEAMLTGLARQRREIRTLEVIAADQRVIASHIRPGLALRSPQDPGWHHAVGRIDVEATTLSELHVGIYRQRESLLSAGSVTAIFTGFTVLWALLAWLLLRHFCLHFIEAPGERLQHFRRGAATADILMLPAGIWADAAQTERAKLEKLHLLLHAIRRRSTDIERHLPALGEEVRTVLNAIEDLQRTYPEARQ